MRPTRRSLLATSAATITAGLAGCSNSTGSNTADTEGGTGIALAATWNVMRARLHDAAVLGQSGENVAAASLVGDVFARFEKASGEYGAHEGLESTSEDAYESFEEHLGTARSDFEPGELTISSGDTVAWKHAVGEAHNVVAYQDNIPDDATYWASGGFDSEEAARTGWENGEGAVQSGQSYVRTFETTGTHEYFCTPHEAAGMVGSITVE
mgnify:CR=1 FL=1